MTGPLWRDLTHQQVWEQVHAGPGPYVSDGAATAWRNAESALRQIDSDLDAAVTKAAGWTGTAADAARSGLTPLGGWAVEATGSAGRAAASLTEHQVQVAWVRANLPEPGPAPAIDPPIPLSDAGVDPAVLQNWTVTVGRNTALADQAFHVMDTYATNTALIQQQVPPWTPPPAVTVSVAGGPPPSGAAMTPPQRAVGTFPATTTPAAAPPNAAAGAAAGVAVGLDAAQRPAGGATAQDASGVGRLPPAAVSTITPTSPARPASGGRGSASRDNSAPPVPGGLVGRTPPDEPGVLRGGPDGAALSARGGAGGFDGSGVRPGTSGPGSTGDADGVLRGLPNGDGTATGVLRGGRSGDSPPPFNQDSSSVGRPRVGSGAGTGGGPGLGVPGGRPANPGGPPSGRPAGPGTGYLGADPGGANLGGRSADVGLGYPGGRADLGTGAPGGQLGGGTPADPQSTFRGPAATTGRPGAEGSPGYLPMGGGGLGNRGDTHRTPDYLVGTYAFFADDRRIAGPLITPQEPPPLRKECPRPS